MTHLPPRVAFSTATTGTGAVTVGAAVAQMLTPAQANAVDGASYLWLIQEGNDWQLVRGAYTASGLSFSRDTTILSLIGGTPGTSNLDLGGDGVVRMVLDAEEFVTLTGSETLTDKRVTPRIGTTASSSTPTPSADSHDQFNVTALAEAATFGAPTGTPTDGQKLIVRILDNGTARTLAWNAIYRELAPLPDTTVISKTLCVGFIYNAASSTWDCVAVVEQP